MLVIPVNALIIGFTKTNAEDAASLPSSDLNPATNVFPTLLPAVNNADPIPAFFSISRPRVDAIEVASFLDTEVPIDERTVSAIFSPAIFLMVSAPIMIATVLISRFSRNSMIPSYTSPQLTFIKAVDTVSNKP